MIVFALPCFSSGPMGWERLTLQCSHRFLTELCTFIPLVCCTCVSADPKTGNTGSFVRVRRDDVSPLKMACDIRRCCCCCRGDLVAMATTWRVTLGVAARQQEVDSDSALKDEAKRDVASGIFFCPFRATIGRDDVSVSDGGPVANRGRWE